MKATKIVLVSILSVLAVSCRVREINTENTRSASTSMSSVLADSIVVHDSIIIRQTPDTLFFTKYRTFYKERLRYDTLVIRDTVFVNRTITEKGQGRTYSLLWLFLPLLTAVLWKIGFFDLIRKLLLKK